MPIRLIVSSGLGKSERHYVYRLMARQLNAILDARRIPRVSVGKHESDMRDSIFARLLDETRLTMTSRQSLRYHHGLLCHEPADVVRAMWPAIRAMLALFDYRYNGQNHALRDQYIMSQRADSAMHHETHGGRVIGRLAGFLWCHRCNEEITDKEAPAQIITPNGPMIVHADSCVYADDVIMTAVYY